MDLAALGALSVLSGAALGAIIDVGEWQEELGLYLLPAMPSGDRKSTVLKLALAPLRAIDQERRDAAAPIVRERRQRRDVADARMRKLTKTAAEASDVTDREEAERELLKLAQEVDDLGEPVLPRRLADDATPEALSGLIARHGAMAVISAESAFVDNIVHGRYSNGAANLHLVCRAYTGETTVIDRRGRDPEQLERPLLAIGLVVQPHVLQELVDHPIARAQGLVARFAYALPESLQGRRKVEAPRVPIRVSEAWAMILRRVADKADTTDKTLKGASSVSSVSTSNTAQLRLSAEARKLLMRLQLELEPRLAEDGDLREISDWIARHHGRVARIAGLLHLCEHDGTEVSGTTMRSALTIGEYLLEHARAVLTGPDQEIRAALGWLRRRSEPTVSQRELHRGPLGSRGSADQAQDLANRLEQIGAIRLQQQTTSGPGRPPSPMYDVHPDLVGGERAA